MISVDGGVLRKFAGRRVNDVVVVVVVVAAAVVVVVVVVVRLLS